MKWPFADPPNVAVFTSKRILSGEAWIAYVSHDEDDGAWQFHASNGAAPEAEAAVVSLRSIVDADPTLASLADLPLGWCAWRDRVGAPWNRKKIE
ncbi:hypothetical protein [Polyangium sorediatum]|uniref:DUF2185 domain-containing protein n=1 Tax=Polyangium sorediatum TaxID=889274 RepID=A0ABT6NNL8_9BACT|nr:hypothetical protein [Polyangium sorediatum]MDI1429921.1 hypothetical protein [Polyangium sorediatum]